MVGERNLTVREALERPHFESAQLLGGAGGLDRRIRWVHILETMSLEALIHGDEMILTTGMGFHLEEDASTRYMENLISSNAACLCIELSPSFNVVPERLLELSERNHFPLIVFTRTVRFVDITQDLHSLILNRHHRMLQELESLSREFHRLTLSSQGTIGVLKLLSKSTRGQLLFRPLTGKTLIYPVLSVEAQRELVGILDSNKDRLAYLKPNADPILLQNDGKTAILTAVGALDQTWAWLLMVCSQKPAEYEFLLLDSAALAIAQELLRTRYMEERRQFSENIWVDELLNSRLPDEKQLKALVGADFKRLNEMTFRVCLVEMVNLHEDAVEDSGAEWDALYLHLSLLLRSTFERCSFRPLITLKNNRLAVIALDIKSKAKTKARLQAAMEALKELQNDERFKSVKLIAGVGKPYRGLSQAYCSYQESIQALSLHGSFDWPVIFYEDLGIFQLLLNLNDGNTLQQFIRSYLGPLIDHDESRGSELLLTLKVFLDHDGSKQIAAQKLFYRPAIPLLPLGKDRRASGQRFHVAGIPHIHPGCAASLSTAPSGKIRRPSPSSDWSFCMGSGIRRIAPFEVPDTQALGIRLRLGM